ncbi:RagB/SusD family nutrient uptake outer membrane protein [Parapedobacter deserti]|uniref:RagB/SusD family nutrient uptake outer membrane protein n=1 Tax=Parapedobacter deserti TaxID=1912957 RepID=A0ABV7JJM2_9SPHI
MDLKPDKKLVIPATLTDVQALLNNAGFLNTSEEAMPEMSADNYYLTDDAFNALGESSRLIYVWDKNASSGGSAWSSYYRTILYANEALATLDGTEGPEAEKAILRGKALFFRANAFYHLAQIFCKPYGKNDAADNMGLPLRLAPGISDRSERATLSQTYDRIIKDFSDAIELLPDAVSEVTTQPNIAAVYAGLARTYLLMGEYENALAMANASLTIYDTLIDYNELDTETANPVELFNKEVIYYSNYGGATLLRNNTCNVDSNLFNSYEEDDLRKSALFDIRDDGTVRFKGNYAGNDSQGIFNGMTTAEVMLIKAECLVRLGDLPKAQQALNGLLINRYEIGKFHPVNFEGFEEGLRKIIDERRKELLFRGSRWIDLRRLNREGSLQLTIYRNIGSNVYSLPPNDNRYVFRIPDEVIASSGMEQNQR